MRTGLFLLGLLTACQAATAQRVGIGTTDPLVRLSVDSSIMLDQANANQGNLGAGALLFGSNGQVGISRSHAAGLGQDGLGFYTGNFRRMLLSNTGFLGINTSEPLQRLHVSGNAYITGNMGVGISDPLYDLHIGNSARIGGYLGINADPDVSSRLKVGGHVHIDGTSFSLGVRTPPSSTYSIDVAGPVRIQNDMRINGILNPNNALAIGNNTTIDGSLTVGGRGIIRGNNSAQWRLVRFSVGYAGGVAANSDLIGAQLNYNLGGGTIAAIWVGPVITVGSGASNLGSLALVPVDMTSSSCRFLIMNGSGTTANMGTNENPTVWQLTALVYD